MNRFFLLLTFFVGFSAAAQKYVRMDVFIDTSGFGVHNRMTMSVTLYKKNGSPVEVTTEEGRSKWGKLKVSGTHLLRFDKGELTWNAKQVHEGNRVMTLRIETEDGAVKAEKSILLPYLKELVIYNETLPVNRETRLDYACVFSNGKSVTGHNELYDISNLRIENFDIALNSGELLFHVQEPVTDRFRTLRIADRRSGAIVAVKELAVIYPFDFRYNGDGANGVPGRSGAVATRVSENGHDGMNGLRGDMGAHLRIFLDQTTLGEDTIIAFHVFAPGGRIDRYFIRFSRGNEYYISACGGTGGAGGNGTDGRPGDIDTAKRINSPHGGNGGRGGDGGIGGDGGRVQIYFSPVTEYLKPALIISVAGGTGGSSGLAGKGGRGDHNNSKLLGSLLRLKDGADGLPGMSGMMGSPGSVEYFSLPDRESWIQEYEKAAGI